MANEIPEITPYDIERAVRESPITAKFKVTSVGEAYDDQVSIWLLPDYNDGRNKEWAKYTPAGQIQLTVLESVAGSFPLGQSFTVTFTPEEH